MSIQHSMTGGALRLRRMSICLGEGAGSIEAVRQLDLTIDAGNFVGILGPSGCGKSTLLGAVAGLTSITAGEVEVDGQSVGRPGPDRGLVFQHHTLFPWKTVFQNVEFGLKMRGIKRRLRHENVEEILGQVGLADFRDHFPAQLSGGMQQRVNLARALVNRPRVLLMDEPFAALDAQTRLLMQELLLEVWTRSRMTVLFVTHDIDEALFLSDRVVLLSRRPAQVRADLPVDLERPRTLESLTSPAFVALKRRCWEMLRLESPAPSKSRDTAAAGIPFLVAPDLRQETPA